MVTLNITDNVVKINNDSNIYYIKDLNIIIDAGNSMFYDKIKEELEEICDLRTVRSVILTHLHYDHIGCYNLFENADFYCHGDIIEDFKNRKEDYILDARISEMFDVELRDISELELPLEYKIIYTPGHCRSCLCLYDSKNYILYSGDTLFFNGMIGRYDLPTSDYDDLKKSLLKLDKLVIKKLCPGHDY